MSSLIWLLRTIGVLTFIVSFLYLQVAAIRFLWTHPSWHTVFALRYQVMSTHWQWVLVLATGLVSFMSSFHLEGELDQSYQEDSRVQ